MRSNKLFTNLGNSLNTAKSGLIEKKNVLENDIQKSLSKVKNYTASISKNIEENTKKISCTITKSVRVENVLNELLRSSNLEKTISAMKTLEVVDVQTKSTIDLLI